ncbi:hypothetical protein YC2023_035812 [Brassica napus]
MDLNSRPPLEPPDPPDRATSSQSKTFTVIVPFFPLELVLVDSKNLLVLSVSHSLLAYACHFVNLLVSTILKPRTLEVFVVLLDGLNFSPESGLESLHLFHSQQFMSIRRPKVGLHSNDQICSLKGREDNHPPATSLFPAPSFPSPMWESTPASSFEPSICKSGVRCRWESTLASSSEPSKASKVMLSTHNSHFLLCHGE